MTDEITPLRDEVAALRAELKELRLEHRKLLRMVGILPLAEGEKWPEYLHLDAACLAVRDDPLRIPIIMRSEGERSYIAFMDKECRTRVELSLDVDGPRFEMYNAEGKRIFQLAEATDGSGQVCVCDAEGRPRAGLRVNESGGVVNVVDAEARAQVVMLGTPEGGQILAANAAHHASATMKATETGGMVCVHEPSGQLMGFLSASTDCGTMSVYGPHGAIAAGIVANEAGGTIIFHDIDGEPKAHLP